MARDARAEARRERDYYARQDRIRCAVCGKHFLTRDKRGWCCSRSCREKLEGVEGQALPSQ